MFEPLTRDKCCGCLSCVDACSQGAIGIEKDKLGFAYPILISEEKCIICKRCVQVCPGQTENIISYDVGEVYCAHSKNALNREKASSGGIFAELADRILEDGGAVIGAAFDERFLVRHEVAQSEDEVKKLYGSKYTQSDTRGIYRKTHRLLKEGRPVLFSGTPCQAAALKKYLGREYENLYVVDLFCYGIPSPVVWQEWLRHISQGRQPVSVNFRDKTEGWDNYSLRVEFSDASVYRRNKKQDAFLKTFSKGCYIRQSCLSCRHKAFPRTSDLTLGDFQELKELFPEKNGFHGMSMIKVNTAKGQALLDRCAPNLEAERVSAQAMDACHPGIGRAAMRHPNREIFAQKLGSMPIERLLNGWAVVPLKQKLRQTAIKLVKRLGIYEMLRSLKNKG